MTGISARACHPSDVNSIGHGKGAQLCGDDFQKHFNKRLCDFVELLMSEICLSKKDLPKLVQQSLGLGAARSLQTLRHHLKGDRETPLT